VPIPLTEELVLQSVEVFIDDGSGNHPVITTWKGYNGSEAITIQSQYVLPAGRDVSEELVDIKAQADLDLATAGYEEPA